MQRAVETVYGRDDTERKYPYRPTPIEQLETENQELRESIQRAQQKLHRLWETYNQCEQARMDRLMGRAQTADPATPSLREHLDLNDEDLSLISEEAAEAHGSHAAPLEEVFEI